MSSKRKCQYFEEIGSPKKKHTLDSDEEDSDEYEKEELNYSDIDGEEDGVPNTKDDVKFTPFNMREELQEGHFDKEGQYHWNKRTEIRDNWLDNIDWMKIKENKTKQNVNNENIEIFNTAEAYSRMLEYMETNDTVQQTLQKLGKANKNTTTAERLRLKKIGMIDESSEKIAKFTEIINMILTQTGNMDIYEENYSQIKNKAIKDRSDSSNDMYSDDFDKKEKLRLNLINQTKIEKNNTVFWEFKWKLSDEKVNGPYSTEQMLNMKKDKDFGSVNVYIRRVGQSTNFHSISRIDFELYI